MPYKNKERRKQVVYRWRAKNLDYYRTYQREWYADNREKMRSYFQQRTLLKDGISSKWLAWKEKYPERYRLSSKNWRLNNPDKVKEWRENNRDKIRLYQKVANLQRRKTGHLSIKVIQQVYENNIKQYGTLTCILCNKFIKFGQDNIEHKTPISRGGTHALSNLAIAHGSCNRKKHNKTLEEWYNSKKEEISSYA